MAFSISKASHPTYIANQSEWEKYRYIMEGGDKFIEKYLVRFSSRETDESFKHRKNHSLTPIPGFTRGAILDVKNAIFQRMADIKRTGGSTAYTNAVAGSDLGVDLEGSTINHFIGRHILPELLFMGKVGVYVDMPPINPNATLAETKNLRPYLYYYPIESIVNWEYEYPETGRELSKLLLEETYLVTDTVFGLPVKEEIRYRYLEKVDGRIVVKYFSSAGERINIQNEYSDEDYVIDIPRIPFVIFELDQPLTKDIANHQIALLNLESSDISYSLKSNLTFYTEQHSGMVGADYLKQSVDGREENTDDIEVGGMQGRRYTKDLDRPGFISPSSEPLNASVAKQQALKDDIRMLINLALSNINSKYSSAESKSMDERGLESGLSNLGLILEHGERQIARLFADYENINSVATIHYPQRYSLKTDLERIKEADALGEQRANVPSKRFHQLISKEIVEILLGSKISKDDYNIIVKEIETAKTMTSAAEDIYKDIEHGLVGLVTAAEARGYDSEEVEKAAKDHAARLMRIKMSQSDDENSGARGIDDEDPDPGNTARNEKKDSQNPDLSDTGQKQVRGDEK